MNTTTQCAERSFCPKVIEMSDRHEFYARSYLVISSNGITKFFSLCQVMKFIFFEITIKEAFPVFGDLDLNATIAKLSEK